MYGLLLYDGSEYGYACASAFTEEGLDRAADRYQSGEWSKDYAGEDGRESLRWSTCDSPHHNLAEVVAPPLVSGEELFDLWKLWGQDATPGERYKQRIRVLCMTALAELDAEGLFGSRRSILTLMIQDRDGSESLEEVRGIITELNPPEALERFDRSRAALERSWACRQR